MLVATECQDIWSQTFSYKALSKSHTAIFNVESYKTILSHALHTCELLWNLIIHVNWNAIVIKQLYQLIAIDIHNVILVSLLKCHYFTIAVMCRALNLLILKANHGVAQFTTVMWIAQIGWLTDQKKVRMPLHFNIFKAFVISRTVSPACRWKIVNSLYLQTV